MLTKLHLLVLKLNGHQKFILPEVIWTLARIKGMARYVDSRFCQGC